MSEQLQNNPHQPLIDAYNQYGVAMQAAIEDRAEKVEQGFVHGTEEGKMLQTGHVASLADDVEHGKTQQEVTSMDNEIAATKAKLENPFLRTEERAKLKADLKDYKALKKVAKSEHQETVDAFRDLLSAEAQAKVQEDVDSRLGEFWGDNYATTPKADSLDVPAWVNGGQELPKREVGATLDGTEGTHNYFEDRANTAEQSREERLDELAQRQVELHNEYVDALTRGQEAQADISRIMVEWDQVRSEFLETKYEGVSDSELQNRLGELTGEDDVMAHDEVRDELVRRNNARKAQETQSQSEDEEAPVEEATEQSAEVTPEDEEEQTRRVVRGRWSRIRRGLRGMRNTASFANAWVQSHAAGRFNRNSNRPEEEQSRVRRLAPLIGGAATGAALVAGIWMQNKGYINVLPHYNGNTDSWVFNELFDLNPMDSWNPADGLEHTLAHKLGSQQFADFITRVNELKDSGLTDAQIGEMLENLSKAKS